MTDFANKAMALDNRLFNFRTLRPRNEPQYYREHQYVHPCNSELTTSDPIPMEIDTTRKTRGKDRAEEEKRRRNNECYNCGKSGYYSLVALPKNRRMKESHTAPRRPQWEKCRERRNREKRIPGSRKSMGTPGEEN
jgi:hypothetical protein